MKIADKNIQFKENDGSSTNLLFPKTKSDVVMVGSKTLTASLNDLKSSDGIQTQGIADNKKAIEENKTAIETVKSNQISYDVLT